MLQSRWPQLDHLFLINLSSNKIIDPSILITSAYVPASVIRDFSVFDALRLVKSSPSARYSYVTADIRSAGQMTS
jgi:hypothetical protein